MKKDMANTFIPAFYAGRSILISGSTGFLGKVLCEKLLRSCPHITEIFVLIRPKKQLNVKDRLKKMLENKLFDILRSEQPSALNKLIPIASDMSVKGLKLAPSDREMLIEKVSVIFHVAASVRFDESLRDAIFNNTRSTRDLCILATEMKKLVVLQHVSSTYTQIDKSLVHETLYPSELDWKEAIKVAESVDEHTLKTFTAKYLGGTMPNTYTFTKRLAEAVISDYSKSLPCAIIRPSIVVSTAIEPVAGWLDNLNGPIGLFIGGGKGVLRVVYVDPIVTSDFMPVDVAIKALIIAAWQRGIKSITEDNTVHVYNSSSHDVKQIKMKDLIEMALQITKEIPLDNIIWSPGTKIITNRSIYYILVLIMHILPSLFIDGIMKLFGARPMLLKLQRKIYCANNALSYFLTNNWMFHNKKLLNLFDNLSEQNKNFGFAYRDFNIENYFRNGLIGAKIYLLKEDMNQLEAAKCHRKRMDWLNRITKTLFVILILFILYRSNMLSYITNFFIPCY